MRRKRKRSKRTAHGSRHVMVSISMVTKSRGSRRKVVRGSQKEED